MSDITIRPAAQGDAGLILAFILELAEYEKLAHAVLATEDGVRGLLFDPNPRAFCDIAEIGGEPVGFAFWFYNVSTFEGRCGLYLEDLYVRPAARGVGAGKALLAHLARRCVDEGLGAIIAVYLVLGILYESFAHPFTILSTLPSALFGALLALRVTGFQFTLIASIACVLLVGMVMKNAIMMVDFALELQRGRGLSPRDAVREAALQRARPIIMTTLVAILSALPLALGTGPGHELRQPLGIANVGGLAASQILTLYTTPVIYLLIARLKLRWGRREAAIQLTSGGR